MCVHQGFSIQYTTTNYTTDYSNISRTHYKCHRTHLIVSHPYFKSIEDFQILTMAMIMNYVNTCTWLLLILLLEIVMNCSAGSNADMVHLNRDKRTYEGRRNKDNILKQHLSPSGKGSVFVTENSTTVVAQTGGTAKLPCTVRKFNTGVVSWVRLWKDHSPPTILTIGVTRYIVDERFLVEHARHLQNWGLVIRQVRPSDAGLYECQVSTHPATSIFIELRVTEASAEIIGAPDLHVRAGSSLHLVCTIRQSTEPPLFVFWYHNQKMINHEHGVNVTIMESSSILQLPEADTTNSGNYTCEPSNAIAAHINVHVLNATEEENPAAMLHASSSGISTALFMSVLLIVTFNISLSLNS